MLRDKSEATVLGVTANYVLIIERDDMVAKSEYLIYISDILSQIVYSGYENKIKISHLSAGYF